MFERPTPISRTGEDWINMYMEYTSNTISPPSYHTWMALACLASAAQRKIYVQIGHNITFPNLFVIMVGPTANGKGVAMRISKRLINQYVPDIKLAADSSSRRALMEEIGLAQRGKHLWDMNEEGFHCSLTAILEEVINFFANEPQETRDFLAQAYDCEDWKHRTKHHGHEILHNIFLNFIGATTEEIVKRILPEEAFSGGFASRIIFIYEDRYDEKRGDPFKEDVNYTLEKKLAQDLQSILQIYGKFDWSDDARDFYRNYCEVEEKKLKLPTTDKRLDGYNRRKIDQHLVKIAMLCSLSESNDLVLHPRHLERAQNFLDEVEPKIKGAFNYLGENKLAILMSEIEKQVKLVGTVKKSELLVANSYNVRYSDFHEILVTLKACNKIDIVLQKDGSEDIVWKGGK